MYRGKYPNRIKAMWSNRKNPNIPKGCYIQTNVGNVYHIVRVLGIGHNIKLGEDIASLTNFVLELREKL